ncbi:MAG TPA: hypothetical protein VFL17_07160 [Anaerolineae bacterium]|nr:hypothetical protein [Anaerolineae bacterium]
MPTEVVTTLITSLFSAVIVAVVTYLLTRRKNLAEIEKLRAETEKARAETERIRFDLMKATATGGGRENVPNVAEEPSSDADAVAAIRREAADLLKVTRSAPGGLWLMAEATTGQRDSLLQIAGRLKPEHRAEALAHLAYTLTVFKRSQDAQHVAEQSLAATDDVPTGLRIFSLVNVAEKFAEAQLTPIALQAAEQALREARASRRTDGLPRLARVLVRVSSVSKGLEVAQSIEDPKARCDVLAAILAILIERGESDDATRVFQKALSTSLEISKASDRASALAERARELARLGRYNESSRLAKQAREEALKINREELFGKLTIDIITSDMSLLERLPDEILRIAERQRNPGVLVRLARFMPKRSEETVRVVRSALAMAKDARAPVVLAEVAELLDDIGSPKEATESAKRATEIALQSNDPRTRAATLQRTSEILARSGDFETALAAAAGIGNVKNSAEAILKVLSRCYAQRRRAGAGALEILSHAYSASASLEDKDRSSVLMRVAASQAFLRSYREAYHTARQAPLSGHRLAAYSIIILVYELALDEAKLRGASGDALMVMLAPIFEWGLE